MKTELIEKLKAFGKAARELSDEWIDVQNTEVLIKGYPFNESFDDIVGSIDQWVKLNNPIEFRSGWFHTYIADEEICSNSLGDVERELADIGGRELGSPIIYKYEDLPDSTKEYLDENLYDYILVYPNTNYIGILK